MYKLNKTNKEQEYFHHNMKQTGWTLPNQKYVSPKEMQEIMATLEAMIKVGKYQAARGIENMRQYPKTWLDSTLIYAIETEPKGISNKLKNEFKERGFR
jgi:hypothetical protein